LQIRPVGGSWVIDEILTYTAVFVDGLVADTEYQYRVRTRCNGTWQSYTPFSYFTTTGGGGLPCGPTTGLFAETLASNAALLGWHDMSADLYRVQVRPASGNWIVNETLTNTSIIVEGLQENEVYRFRVRTKCGADWQDYSDYYEFSINAATNPNTQRLGNTTTLLNKPMTKLFAGTSSNWNFTIAPNPTRGETRISYELPSANLVNISVYDLQGRLVQSVKTQELQEAGIQQINFSVDELPRGMYHVRLETEDHFEIAKMIVID